MPTTRVSTRAILPLADPAILVVNDSPESSKAKTLLDEAGVWYEATREVSAPPADLPLVIYGGTQFRGLMAIEGWVRLLQHWSKTIPDSRVFSQGKRVS